MQEMPNVDNFTPEQLEAISKMTSLDEVMNYVNEESIDLTDEQLESISGGDYSEYIGDAFSLITIGALS